MKLVLLVIAAILLLLAVLLCAAWIHTLLVPRKTADYVPHPDEKRALEYAQKLSRMVACDTTSHQGMHDREKFLGFQKLLAEMFPLVHEKLEKTEIDGNLLF